MAKSRWGKEKEEEEEKHKEMEEERRIMNKEPSTTRLQWAISDSWPRAPAVWAPSIKYQTLRTPSTSNMNTKHQVPNGMSTEHRTPRLWSFLQCCLLSLLWLFHSLSWTLSRHQVRWQPGQISLWWHLRWSDQLTTWYVKHCLVVLNL